MKRRIICLFLTFLLIIPLNATVSADNSGLCFTALNDTLLDLSSMATNVSGMTYVPCRVFSTFGVYYTYFEASTTAMLNNGNKQIYFELNTGNSYDSNGTNHSVSAIFKNNQVYVPVAWVCSYYNLSYSYISGTGNGDIVRIKNGSEVLSDSQFFDAATSLMRSRYNEYYGTTSPSTPATPVPTQQPQPSESPTDQTSISLSVIGLPSKKVLDNIDNYSLKLCFFITAEEAEESPDIIRRIYGSGHNIGIYCKKSPESELEKATEVIFDIAQIRPILVTSPQLISNKCSEYSNENAFSYYNQSITLSNFKSASEVTKKIENSNGYISISLFAGDNLDKNIPYILQYIALNRISVLPVLDIYA